MPKSDYAPFLDRLISRYEGGYGWDQADPGGPTKYGITCYDLAEHRGQKMTSMASWAPIVRNMTREEAEEIYAKKYAEKIGFDYLVDGPDVVLLDYAVNSGYARAIRVVRAILKAPGSDVMTPDLVAGVNKLQPNWFIDRVCDERLGFMHTIRGGTAWKRFGTGWQARVTDLRAYAKALAAGDKAAPAPSIIAPAPAKVTHDDPNLMNRTVTRTGGGSVVSIISAYAAQPDVWFIGLCVALIVGAGVVYYFIKKGRAEVANAKIVLPEVPLGVQNVAKV